MGSGALPHLKGVVSKAVGPGFVEAPKAPDSYPFTHFQPLQAFFIVPKLGEANPHSAIIPKMLPVLKLRADTSPISRCFCGRPSSRLRYEAIPSDPIQAEHLRRQLLKDQKKARSPADRG